jgi:cytochrome c553
MDGAASTAHLLAFDSVQGRWRADIAAVGADAVRIGGQALATQGDAARQLPACSACHGLRLTGVQPAVPGLLGLPRDYLIGQLGAWQTGQRHAIAPDCMARIAQRLTPDDVGAVAAWLAALPVPSPAQADASAPGPARLPCGSTDHPPR